MGVWVAVRVAVGVLLISGVGVLVGDGNAVLVMIIRGVVVGSWAICVASSVISTVGVMRGMASPLHPAISNIMLINVNMTRLDMPIFPYHVVFIPSIMTQNGTLCPLRQ